MTSRCQLVVRRGCVVALAFVTLTLTPIAGLAGQAPDTEPKNIGDGWEKADVSTSGFDGERLQSTLAGVISGDLNIHSVIVERHGRLVAELYRSGKNQSVYLPIGRTEDFGPTDLHDMRSIGKSVVSLLLGIAKQQGKIDDLSVPALDYYPEYADLVTPERKTVTLEHLLTMSAGFEWSEGGGFPDNEHHLYWAWSPYRYVLSRPLVSVPGSKFNYNSGGTAVIADILTRVTGMPLKELVRQNLFEPLGISDWEWTADLHGRPMAFVGLRLRPRDLAKIGRLVVDHGMWRGRQIVPADWIAASLKPRIRTGFADFQYGYQWWLGTVEWHGKQLPWGAAFGNGGQRLFVLPDLDMTVVMTAGAYNDPQSTPRFDALFRALVATVRE